MKRKTRNHNKETVQIVARTTGERDIILGDFRDDHNIFHIQWNSQENSIFISFKGRKHAANWLATNHPRQGTSHVLTGRPKIILDKRYQWKLPNSRGIRGILSWTRQEIITDPDLPKDRTYIISRTLCDSREDRSMYLNTFHYASFPSRLGLFPKVVWFN
jgi:hypothetical protein